LSYIRYNATTLTIDRPRQALHRMNTQLPQPLALYLVMAGSLFYLATQAIHADSLHKKGLDHRSALVPQAQAHSDNKAS